VRLRVGTSGWQYDHWRHSFYPPGVPVRRWLEYYAERFATVESNSAFYRLPERATFEDWRSRTPEDFDFAVKASRYLTHVRRLRDPAEPVRRLLERIEGLGPKCGPVLLQLPPNLPAEVGALAGVLDAFPPSVRVAVEPRHPSWFTSELRELLEHRGAALCLSDLAGRHPPLWRTAGFGYMRFHRGRSTPTPCYGRDAIASWTDRLLELWPGDEVVFCYFNNDERACALRDAGRLARRAASMGAEVTRTPRRGEVGRVS